MKTIGRAASTFGRLETDVVDVEPEVHELPVEVEERGRCRRSAAPGASFTTPVIMSGATSPAAARHREDQAGQDATAGLPGGRPATSSRHFVAPSASEASPHAARDRGERLLGRHDDDRDRQERERQRAPRGCHPSRTSASEAPRRRRTGRWPADAVDEEPEAEDAEDDRRNAREVVHGDPDERGRSRPWIAYSRR